MKQINMLKMLEDILIKIENLKKKEYIDLVNKIKSIDKLKFLFTNDDECIDHIHRCILNVPIHPFLNEYINLYLKYNPEKINEQDKNLLKTPLMYACDIYDKNSETINIILNYSPNLEIKNYVEDTVLLYVCKMNTKNLNKIIKLLIDKGANVNIINIYFKNTPLHSICMNKCSDKNTYKLLLKANANPNYKNVYNHKAIIYFIKNKSKEDDSTIIDLFIKYGLIFDNINNNLNYIDYALVNEKIKCLNCIIKYYNNLDIMSGIKIPEFNYKTQKIIKILYHYNCDFETLKLAISKGANKKDLINENLINFF